MKGGISAKQEVFARAIVEGKTIVEAQVAAGYRPNKGNGVTLKSRPAVAARIAELKAAAAVRTEITAANLVDELEEARQMAMSKGQVAAAVSATMGKAKLLGLIKDRVETSGPNGAPIVTINHNADGASARERIASMLDRLAAAEGSEQHNIGYSHVDR